jgi:parallel beta-helix repeat protein
MLGGGGIFCGSSSPSIRDNTITGNYDGIICLDSSPTLVNCILWDNRPWQINGSSSNIQVTYSDIQDTLWPGTGNINAWPAFVDTAQDDYRLLWDSPCIDTGDPNPIYNNPDSTRADMGAWYFDQSMPVRILLTPYNAPIEIPASGGSFQYALLLTNISTTTLPVLGWCNVTLPSGGTYGPVLGPMPVSVPSGLTLSRVRTQTVPASAPAGLYHYNAFAVTAGDTSQDSFTFTKAGAGGVDGLSGWSNTGELFLSETTQGEASLAPTQFALHPCSPNPFNPTTTISYQLSADSHVTLKVYNTTGRMVAELVNGMREAGSHQVTFDGSRLSSGLYFVRMQAGSYSAVRKMILIK